MVYNEVQSQFARLDPYDSLVKSYLDYTYPYGLTGRLASINAAVKQREIQGIIHYTQTFCFRQIDNIMVKELCGVPVLHIEGDRPGAIDARLKIRIDSFLEMLVSSINNNQADLAWGLDVGSRYVKLVRVNREKSLENSRIKTLMLEDTVEFYKEHGQRENEEFRLNLAGLPDLSETSESAPLVATGYGRSNISGARIIAELSAHVKGAAFQCRSSDFTLLDIGGQDTKVVLVKNNRMVDFETNDKCAASTGRYLENMARILGMDISEIGEYQKDPVQLSATCAIFGETELVCKIAEGYSLASIAAGVNESIYQRLSGPLKRLLSPTIVFCGGVAQNKAVAGFIKERLGVEILIPPLPQWNGAIGAALSALQ